MSDEELKIAKADGFSAQGSNIEQKANPYTKLARAWDIGWRERKEMELRHRLEEDKIDDIPTLVIGWRQSLTTLASRRKTDD